MTATSPSLRYRSALTLPRGGRKLALPRRRFIKSPLSSHVIDSAAVDPIRDSGDTAEVRVTFDRSSGCERLEQRVIRFAEGRSRARSLNARQEILYVVSGRGTIHVDGRGHALEPDTGVYCAC